MSGYGCLLVSMPGNVQTSPFCYILGMVLVAQPVVFAVVVTLDGSGPFFVGLEHLAFECLCFHKGLR